MVNIIYFFKKFVFLEKYRNRNVVIDEYKIYVGFFKMDKI